MFGSHVFEFDTFEFPIAVQCACACIIQASRTHNSQWPCLITFLTLFTSLLNMHHSTHTYTHGPINDFISHFYRRYRVSVCACVCFGACFTKVIFTVKHTQTQRLLACTQQLPRFLCVYLPACLPALLGQTNRCISSLRLQP